MSDVIKLIIASVLFAASSFVFVMGATGSFKNKETCSLRHRTKEEFLQCHKNAANSKYEINCDSMVCE